MRRRRPAPVYRNGSTAKRAFEPFRLGWAGWSVRSTLRSPETPSPALLVLSEPGETRLTDCCGLLSLGILIMKPNSSVRSNWAVAGRAAAVALSACTRAARERRPRRLPARSRTTDASAGVEARPMMTRSPWRSRETFWTAALKSNGWSPPSTTGRSAKDRDCLSWHPSLQNLAQGRVQGKIFLWISVCATCRAPDMIEASASRFLTWSSPTPQAVI